MKYKVYTDEVEKNKKGDVVKAYIKEQVMYDYDKASKKENLLTIIPCPMFATNRR